MIFHVCACSQTVEEEALIKNNNTCKDFLIEAMKYHLLPLDQRQLIKNPRTKPRTPVSLPKVSRVCRFVSPHTVLLVALSVFERSLRTCHITSHELRDSPLKSSTPSAGIAYAHQGYIIKLDKLR